MAKNNLGFIAVSRRGRKYKVYLKDIRKIYIRERKPRPAVPTFNQL